MNSAKDCEHLRGSLEPQLDKIPEFPAVEETEVPEHRQELAQPSSDPCAGLTGQRSLQHTSAWVPVLDGRCF